MAKIVRLVAEVRADLCTGCRLCALVCPTAAIAMRPRRQDEPGPGRSVAAIDGPLCYNAQNCLEICPEAAIVMRPLATPFTVGVDANAADPARVADLCLRAGLLPDMRVCFCMDVRAAELAAAILLGADTPERVSVATGARTGCTELCQQPILRLLAAAGHPDPPRTPRHGVQWYGRTGTLLEALAPDLGVPPDLEAAYPRYPIARDRNALLGNLDES